MHKAEHTIPVPGAAYLGGIFNIILNLSLYKFLSLNISLFFPSLVFLLLLSLSLFFSLSVSLRCLHSHFLQLNISPFPLSSITSTIFFLL